jgi:hypothetical protein
MVFKLPACPTDKKTNPQHHDAARHHHCRALQAVSITQHKGILEKMEVLLKNQINLYLIRPAGHF